MSRREPDLGAAPVLPPPVPAAAAVPAPVPVAVPLKSPPPTPEATIVAAIATAEAEGRRAELGGLYYARAMELRGSGAIREAADFLRRSIMIASELRQVEIHARSRLELGDIAREEGDLITACEHWQLARTLFAEAGRASDSTTAEKRMEASRCPTDWVLNDF